MNVPGYRPEFEATCGRQIGGGRPAVGVLNVAELRRCEIECGSVESLSDLTSLRVERVLEVNEVEDDMSYRVVAAVPKSICLAVCVREQLRKICRQHQVPDVRGTLSGIQNVLRDHQCHYGCPAIRLLLTRPERVQWSKKSTIDFRYLAGSPSRFHYLKEGTLQLEQFAGTDVEANTVRGMEYAFAEPVVSISAGPLEQDNGTSADDLLMRRKFPPKPLPLSEKMKIVRNWVRASSAYALSEGPCAVCARNVLLTKLSTVSLDDDCFVQLLEYVPDVTRNEGDDVEGLERILLRDALHLAKGFADVCQHCLSSLRKNRLPPLAMANGLWLGRVPDELRALNFVEKMLVARYRHNMCVVTISGGARQMRANALVCAQPVAQFYRVLPPSPEDLAGMLAIFCTGPCKLSEEEMKRAPVYVRPEPVLRALEWLKAHHSDYGDLEISYENLRMYDGDRPAVDWFYHPSDGKEPLESLAVYEGGIEVDTGDGSCPFVVYGLCPEDVLKMNYDDRMKLAVAHLRKGGKVLGYGQSSKPESIYHNPRMYPGMFPWLFPYGLGGFENELMVVGVPRKTHVKYLLSYFDRRFQTDGYFIFLAYNQEQIRACSKGAFVLVERRNFENVVDKILSIDEDALREIAERTKVEGYTVPRNDEERRCFELLSLIDHVGGHVPGSNTRKKWQRSEIKSLIIRYGMPVFFITFAPSESASPICLYLCGEKIDLSSCVPLDISHQQRVDTAVKNPVACSRFFDLMVRLFTEHVLRADTNEEGLFGMTSAYYGTVEEQCRKTLHMHMLLWIAGSLSPEEIRERIMNAEEVFTKEILEWLDSCVQGQCTTGSLREVTGKLTRKGMHVRGAEGHADVWADPRVCLPQCPKEDADPDEAEKWFAQVCAITDEIVALVNVHDKRHPYGCCKPPDYQCRARFPRELVPISMADVDTGSIVLKKGEAWVNTFNVVLTYLLRCNTDVTCLLSGTSVRAVIAYVTDYITKRSLKMGTMMEIILAVYDGKAKFASSCSSKAEIARKLVTKIVNGFTSRLQAGGPSVCAELLGHPDHYTNKYFKVLYWRSYVRFVESAFDLEDEESGDGCVSRHDPEPKDLVVLGRSGGRILGYSKLDDYVYRPDQFGNMCLYDFLRLTDVVRSRKAASNREEAESGSDDGSESDCSDDEADGEVLQVPGRISTCFRFKRGHAKRESHVVVRVSRPEGYVINFAGGLLPRKDVGDRELYCKTMLTLFCPGGWRYGLDLREREQSWEQAFADTTFAPEHCQIMRNMNLLYECQDARDDYAAQRRASAHMEPLSSFLAEADMDELDVAHGDPLMGVGEGDIGSMVSPLDAEVQEGRITSAHRYQMDEMREFVHGQYGGERQGDRGSYRPVSDVLDGVPAHNSRQWKNLLAEARRKQLERMRGSVSNTDEASIAGVFERGCRYDKQDNCVSSLDERAFLKMTGYGTEEVDGRTKLSDDITNAERGLLDVGIETDRRVDVVRNLFGLNDDQFRAFLIVVRHLTTSEKEPLRMLLNGMAGTGKSRVIDALSYYLEGRGESHRMIVLAPTGAAACLLGGSTYHSVLGLGRGKAYPTGHSLGRVRDRLRAVELVVLDEISMVSCHDFYNISERMCLAFDLPMDSFGSRSLLVAGDFAQLPPAGQWSQPLYSATVNSVSSRMTQDSQRCALGKALWHGFTTVVILRENMRQRGSSVRDKAFCEALERMRYGACVDKDILLLDSRLLRRGKTLSSRGMERFKFVPVIVPLNTHRDAINDECCWRFARERGVELCDFYSVDRITSSRVGETMSSIVRGSREDRYKGFGGMNANLRETLWNLPPGATEHAAGRLSLCVGMPVMVKYNEATELGVTNGAEAIVHGWTSRSLSEGKRALTTLFVRLVNPPRPVHVEDLPENVVPITASAEKVKCRLPNDKSVTILREQVPILPYFAMTDFNSQGRTRSVNVVDLRFCRGAQSVYTCLSRSSSIDNTLILYSWGHKKVMNGIRPDLLRELRHLEVLADITKRRMERTLPESIRGSTRSELIETYQRTFGKRYVPDGVHPALRWDSCDEQDVRPPSKPAKWYIVRKSKRGGDDGVEEKKRKRSKVADGGHSATAAPKYSASNVASRLLRPSHVVRLANRGQARQFSGMDGTNIGTVSEEYGPLIWDRSNWSCGYDCFVRVVQHLRTQATNVWSRFSMKNELLNDLEKCFSEIENVENEALLVRDRMRDLLAVRDARAFQRHGFALAAVDQLASALFSTAEAEGQYFKFCSRCGVVGGVRDINSPFWSTGFNVDMRTRVSSVTTKELLASVLKEHGQLHCPSCKSKNSVKYATKFFDCPDMFLLEIPAEDARFPRLKVDMSFAMTLGEEEDRINGVWDLLGVIYLGHQHFTCRLLTRDGRCLWYDGMQNGGQCVPENVSRIDLAHLQSNKACLVIYTRRT